MQAKALASSFVNSQFNAATRYFWKIPFQDIGNIKES